LQYLLQKYSQFLGANFRESVFYELRLAGFLGSSGAQKRRTKLLCLSPEKRRPTEIHRRFIGLGDNVDVHAHRYGGKGVSEMRRVVVLLSVAGVLVAMLVLEDLSKRAKQADRGPAVESGYWTVLGSIVRRIEEARE
jgi:hypothetical protein